MSFQPDDSARALLNRLEIQAVSSAILLSGDWAKAAPPQPDVARNLRQVPGFSSAERGAIRLYRSWRQGMVAILDSSSYGTGDSFLMEFLSGLGVNSVILTGSVQSLDPKLRPGAIVTITDHLNLTGQKPSFATSPIDLSMPYSSRLRSLVSAVDPSVLAEAVLVQFAQPSCETPAEYRMARVLGGDIISSSIALDAIIARALNLDVVGLAYITDMAPGIAANGSKHRHDPKARLRAILSGLISVL